MERLEDHLVTFSSSHSWNEAIAQINVIAIKQRVAIYCMAVPGCRWEGSFSIALCLKIHTQISRWTWYWITTPTQVLPLTRTPSWSRVESGNLLNSNNRVDLRHVTQKMLYWWDEVAVLFFSSPSSFPPVIQRRMCPLLVILSSPWQDRGWGEALLSQSPQAACHSLPVFLPAAFSLVQYFMLLFFVK